MIFKTITAGKRVYFASDFHLGVPTPSQSLERERRIIRWLNHIKNDAQMVFLVGDLFDFWFEYPTVIPKGFSRFQGKLAELSDSGIEIVIFGGNHDMWMQDYFQEEMGIQVLRTPTAYEFNGTRFLVGHGDGLGKGDFFYKILKKIFEGSIPRFLFGRILHPNLGMYLAQTWSANSWRKDTWKNASQDQPMQGFTPETDWIFKYCQDVESRQHHDFYIFGHQHYLADFAVNDQSRYLNLGDWINLNSYAVFDGENMNVCRFSETD